ncbi:MAG: ABC transporter permease subunit [Sphaerochaetaceae bacterium]
MFSLRIPKRQTQSFTTRRAASWILFVPLAVLVTLISIAPSVDAFVASFDVGPGRFTAQEAPAEIALDNYRILFRDKAIFYSLSITALWATANSVLTIAVSMLLAHFMYLRSRLKRKRSLLYPLLMIPLGIPLYIAVPLWRAFIHGDAGNSLFSRFTGITMNLITDPVAAFIAALIVSIWLNVPITTFVIRSHMDHIDPNLIDAARLETKYDVTIMRYIQLPVLRTSMLTMLALNFVKAFKEFTLIHLMTAGGVPLVEGITERYIVGSTTTLGIFIYNLFGSSSYGITAAFSVFMACAVALVLSFWYCSNISDKHKRSRWFVALVTIMLVIDLFLDTVFATSFVSVPKVLILLVLLASFKYRAVGHVGLWMMVGYGALDVLMNGVLEGFSPLIPAAVFVLIEQYGAYRAHGPKFAKRSKFASHIASITEPVGEWAYRITMYMVVTLTAASTVIIVYYLIWLSISGINVCYFDTLFPTSFSLQAFVDIFRREHIGRYFANTMILAAGSALVVPIIVIPAAWFLSTLKKERANAMVGSIHTLGTMGGMHSLIPLFSVFLTLGLINSRFGLILIYVVHAIPFSLVNMKNFFEGYSKELREPAVLEGATTFQYVRWVLVPLARPIIKTSMLMAFLGAWNGFNAPLVLLTEESMYPVSLKLYTFVGSIASGSPQWNLFAAASIVNVIIITLIGGRRLSKDPTEQKKPTY